MVSARWIVKTVDEAAAGRLVASAGLQPVTARILAGRGIEDAAAAEVFFAPQLASLPDPCLMKGVPLAVERLCAARAAGQKVVIYGDYDVDGITGTALLVSFLSVCGIDTGYFIPNRFDDGYGLNADALSRISESGADLVVSVDCGITSLDEAGHCRRLGMDLIIVDHHTPRETLPDACAVINPHQPGCPYPFKQLAGVGVAFNLLMALRGRLREAGAFAETPQPDLREWLDLVALGSIADVVPLAGLNRLFCLHGLKRLSESTRPGVAALKRVAGVDGSVSCGQVGFRLAPRLNAAGRMESAVPGVELLLTGDPAAAEGVAAELDAANAERQATERAILEEAVAMVEAAGRYPEQRSIVLASPFWHQGVVGIVASRLAERYHRPVILISLDQDGGGKGSGRSIPGFDLLECIRAAAAFLERFGGHRHAAGVGLRAELFDRFAEAFEREARLRLAEDDLIPVLALDSEVLPSDVTVELARELKRLEPFGAGNPEPLLLMRRLTVRERKPVGEGHLRLGLAGGGKIFSGIAFRQADSAFGSEVDIAFIPELNHWNGTSRLQLRIRAIRTAE